MPRDPEAADKKVTSFKIRRDLHHRLKVYAANAGTTVTAVLAKALETHLDEAEADAR